tara:strand:- start:11532 stop:13916 length:2385 start_codon:yes stop_codon:yes gene_type:complete
MVLSDLGTDNVVKATGGSRDLANGQIGLFRMAGKTARGVEAVSEMDGYGKKELFQIQVGTGRTQDAGGMTNKNFSTISFTRDDVLDVTFDTAKAPVYSEVTLGYNGTAGSGIKLKENEATTVSLKLFGEQLSYLGYRDGVANMEFSIFSGSPDACDNCLNPCATTSCTSIVRDLVEDIRTYELRAGSDLGTGASIKVGDLVDVIGTYSCTPDLVPSTTTVYYTLELCDDGTSQALAKVQSQYDDGTVVERIEREGTQSTYQIIKSGGAPANFAPTQTYTLEPSGAKRLVHTRVLLDCEVCPTGFSKVTGGHVFEVTLPVEALTVAEVKSAIENNAAVTLANVTDVGRATGDLNSQVYIIVADGDISRTDVIAELIAKAPGAGSTGISDAAQLEVVDKGQSSDVCVSDSDGVASTIAWSTGKSCDIFSKTIELDVDLDCGPFATAAARTTAANAKLAELQAIYTDLSVALSSTDIGECRARYTGTLTSEPVCEGCEQPDPIFPAMPDDYEFSAWSERTVGASEITSFTLTNGFTAIGATETVTVDETSAAVTTKPAGSTFNVQVTTNSAAVDTVVVKIDASDPSTGFAVGDTIVIDADQVGSGFNAGTNGTITLTITGIGGAFPDDCECGIKFVAKNAFLCPPAMLADQIGTFTPKGVKLQVSGGEAPANLLEGYKFVTTPFKVTRHERDFDGTGWGINYMKQEKASAEYFAGISPRRSYAEGYLSGFETKLDPCTQYDKFTVKLRRNPYAGTASRRMGEEIRYVFLIPSNTGCSYESFVGALGGSVDCPKPANN